MPKNANNYRYETIYKRNGWTLRAGVDDIGVSSVFWGHHEICNAKISGTEGDRCCTQCGQQMSPEDENHLNITRLFLRNTIINHYFFYGTYHI